MPVNSMDKLFEEELKDLYSSEKQIIQALPKMIKAAGNPQLKMGFERHLEETKVQLERLDQIFEDLGKRGSGKKCKGMEGLIEEAKELLEEDMEPDLLDAALIGAAQRVEHYEIAGYGTARTFARILGNKKAEKLLQQTLEEEAATDEKLTQIAESYVNREAAMSGGGKK